MPEFEVFPEKVRRMRQKEECWSASVFYVSPSSGEFVLTLPPGVHQQELHGNKRVIGSGIKGLIHYL